MIYHWFDLVAAVFFLACVAYSAFRGFVKELFCVLAWIVGYIGAISLHPVVAPFFKMFFKTAMLVDLASFFSLFAALYISVRLIGFILRRKVGLKNIPPTIDHAFGAVMGAAKSVFFLAIFLSPLNIFPTVKEKLIQNSVTAGVVIDISQSVMSFSGAEFGSVASKAKETAGSVATKAKETAGSFIEKVEKGINRKSLKRMITKRLGDEEDKKAAGDAEQITEEDTKGMDDLLESLQ